MFNTLAQQRLLEKHSFHIGIRQALAMEGLNIFSKYIPGKVWMIMGKAMYLANKNEYPAGELSLLFLHVHIVALWCGLLLGICGLWINDALHLLSWIGLGILGLFTLMLLSKTVYNAVLGLMNKVLKKDELLLQYQKEEEQLKKAMVSAQQVADEIKIKARAEAEKIIEQAQREKDNSISQAKTELEEITKEIKQLNKVKVSFVKKLSKTVNEGERLLNLWNQNQQNEQEEN